MTMTASQGLPRGGGAVMEHKAPRADIEAESDPLRRLYMKLNYMPTPPWATRALLEHVIPLAHGNAWEPAAGQGHMAAVLAERFDEVWRTDVHDHGGLNAIGSFIGAGPDVAPCPVPGPDWIITNPPFAKSLEFVLRALAIARFGVAVLVRTSWVETEERYFELFRDRPPSTIAHFVERVPMHLGAWQPDGSTMTSYTWMVWDAHVLGCPLHSPRWPRRAETIWIPPGCRTALTRPDDLRRFAAASDLGEQADLLTSEPDACAT